MKLGLTISKLCHIAGYAIQIDGKSKEITIENSRLYDLGGGGIRMGTKDDEQSIENITVKNCSLYDGGQLFPMGVGILIQRGTKNILITQNTLYQFFHTAIQIGWSW